VPHPNDPKLKSFIPVDPPRISRSRISPTACFSAKDGLAPRVGVAIGIIYSLADILIIYAQLQSRLDALVYSVSLLLTRSLIVLTIFHIYILPLSYRKILSSLYYIAVSVLHI